MWADELCTGVQVVYLESYQRLKEKGVVKDLQHFSSSDISNAEGAHLFSEVTTLLKQDPGIIKAMAAIDEPSIAAYRYVQILM